MTSERDWRGLLFVAPFLLLYSIILIFPLLRGLWLSLNQVDLFGAGHFVGLGNYEQLLHDPVFGTSLVNEYELLRRNFEFTDEQLREVARNSFEASFLPAEKKLQLLQCLDLTS